MTAPEALPPKFDPKKIPALLKEHDVARMQDLPGDCPEKIVWTTFYIEKKRRKNLNDPAVAKEAIDCVAWLRSQKQSAKEAWEIYGYSYRGATKPAKDEEDRVVRELKAKPSKDVTSPYFDPAKVMIKYDITEFVSKATVE
ncbi:MAG: hypothetical protein KAS32_19630 [Candidatus Peribacteraceae bacterium]|nr:hypothetical protein [Candidatus Peribacteraceae bacterium]